MVVVSALALCGAFVVVGPTGDVAERRVIQRMPAAERRALYEQELRSARSLCEQSVATTNAALRDRCEYSSRFLLAFPECDDACRELAREHSRGPTR
jgi:hypothetical protein